MKTQHVEGVIPGLKSNVFPHHLLFFDTETYIETIDSTTKKFPFRLGVAIYVRLDSKLEIQERQTFKFETTQRYIDILSRFASKDHTLYVFAHNIKFDIMVLNLPKLLNDNGFESQFPVINDRMFIWRVRKGRVRLIFLDTANFGVQSVAKLGETMGLPKWEVDFSTVKDYELSNYCERDVSILVSFVLDYLRFIHTNKLGSFQPTLASQAFSAFRTRFYNHRIYCHNHTSILSIEREAYHGSRVECYRIGKQARVDYFLLDVNSMYLYIMDTSSLPCKLVNVRYNTRAETLVQAIQKYYCIADVTIETSEPAYPLYDRGKLIFPIGRFRTVLHDTELSHAILYSNILEVHALLSYTQANLFHEYARFFYDYRVKLKAENNDSWQEIAKLFGNSLYGKFGQTGHERVTINHDHSIQIERITGIEANTNRICTEVQWYNERIREYADGESTYSHPAIAGAITSEARRYLYHLIKVAGNNNCYYCDTDSLIVNSNGYSNLHNYMDNTTLGKLKIEKTSQHLVLYNAKDYEFGDKIRHKGLPKKSAQLDENKWGYNQFQGFISWLNGGGTDEPKLFKRTKERKTSYDKGYVYEPTGIVYPWHYTD